jgi:hypothetical protein
MVGVSVAGIFDIRAAIAVLPTDHDQTMITSGDHDRSRSVKSAWGAVLGLLLIRFPRPLAEPGVRVSTHRALHGYCRYAGVSTHGDGMLLARHR